MDGGPHPLRPNFGGGSRFDRVIMNEEKPLVFGFCVKDVGDRVFSETGYKSESSIPSRRYS